MPASSPRQSSRWRVARDWAIARGRATASLQPACMRAVSAGPGAGAGTALLHSLCRACHSG
eukprot:3894509-Pyramimonas_sp.AAC.1